MKLNKKKLDLSKLTINKNWKSENMMLKNKIGSQYYSITPMNSKYEKENNLNSFLSQQNITQIHWSQVMKEIK